MSDVVTAVGLILAMEGALYALFPDLMKRMGAQIIGMPIDTLRMVGITSAIMGVAIVWLVRG